MKIIPLDSFDREKSLTELLQGVDINKLKYTLNDLFGGMVCLSNTAGKVYLVNMKPKNMSFALH
jgi:hypothetical protein